MDAFTVCNTTFLPAICGGLRLYSTLDGAVMVRLTRDGWGWSRNGAVECAATGFAEPQSAARAALSA